MTKEHGKKKNKLEGIARFIVEKRKAIYLIYILLAIFCCFSAGGADPGLFRRIC